MARTGNRGQGTGAAGPGEGLSRKESRKTAAIPALISQFDHAKTTSSRVRWAAGNALYSIPAGKEYFDQLAVIAADRTFGADRQMVVDWLGKSRHPDAAAVALAQLDDDTVAGHALDALSKLGAQGVSKQVEPFSDVEIPLVSARCGTDHPLRPGLTCDTLLFDCTHQIMRCAVVLPAARRVPRRRRPCRARAR